MEYLTITLRKVDNGYTFSAVGNGTNINMIAANKTELSTQFEE